MMKNALLETFKKQYVMQAANGFFDQMSEFMNPETSPGLSAGEIEKLRGTWNNSMSELEGQFEAFDKMSKELFGSGFGDVSEMSKASEDPLTGAVKGVSEQTASLIGGQMNAIRINQAESLSIMNESIRYQSEIAANTRYNQHLEGIHSEIKSLNSRNKASGNSDPLKAKGL
jgi:hypothetical protein